ncbi:MAG TPA: SCO family protein, partial [Acidimicrobiales bacterium]|nr:SCO family protein [Acidimicrobiales bacterium]
MEGRGAETTSPGGSEGASRPPEEGHTLSAAERAAAFGRTEPTIPTRFIVIVVAVAVVLAVGGLVGEHVFSSVGLNPTAGSAGTGTGTGVGPGPAAPTVVDPPTASTPATAVSSSLSAFMGLSRAAPRAAPGFSLVDQTGDPVTLAGERGRVVVLTFFDAPCQDICPVLSAELVQ